METQQFKTTVKCSGCLAVVAPILDELAGKDNWNIDLQSPERKLTIETGNVDPDDVSKAFEKVGYNAKPIQ